MNSNSSSVGAVALLAASACATTQTGRLYRLSDGTTAPIVAYHPIGPTRTLNATLPDGTTCAGNYADVTPAELARSRQPEIPLTDYAEPALAVLVCQPRHVLRCTLASRLENGLSYGSCADEKGAEYALVF
jgi:hypothetical protein